LRDCNTDRDRSLFCWVRVGIIIIPPSPAIFLIGIESATYALLESAYWEFHSHVSPKTIGIKGFASWLHRF
jgi:hypothetical protein